MRISATQTSECHEEVLEPHANVIPVQHAGRCRWQLARKTNIIATITDTGDPDELVHLLGQDHSLKPSQDLLRLANEQAQPRGRSHIGVALNHRTLITLEGCSPARSIQAWIEMRMAVSGSLSARPRPTISKGLPS